MKEQGRLRIDLGCGSHKKVGTLGIDIQSVPGVVDYVLDIEHEPLPFEDRSVEYVHSSHFLEHTQDIPHIFKEISRVCADGARLELWTPYAWANDGFVLDHKTFFTEDIYYHICVWYNDHWQEILGTRWILNELQYVIKPETLHYLKRNQIDLDFALKHLHNIAIDFCAYITVLHDNALVEAPPVKRTFSTGRFESKREIEQTGLLKKYGNRLAKIIRSLTGGGMNYRTVVKR